MNRRIVALVVAVVVVAVVVLGLGGIAAYSAFNRQKPTVVINSPPSNTAFHAGDVVPVQSTSTDPSGISRVELEVDGTIVRTDSPVSSQNTFTIAQDWTAVQGTHTLIARAYNKGNTASDPVAVVIDVLGPATPTPVATATSAATATATATVTPPPPTATRAAAVACTNHATFVTDVTVPDGTVMNPGQSFVKTWRVKNTGTCTWSAGYSFAYLRGEQLSAPASVGVPSTPPGATADLTVPMVAASTTGIHNGFWQLRTPRGTLFGARLNVTINVPAGSVATATPVPVSCSGTPVISSFTASTTTITAGQTATLSWGLVSNASIASLDNGIGGVGTPGNINVTPSSTTTYTLTADCGSSVSTATVTIDVVPAATSTPAPTSTLTPTPTATP